MWDLPAILVSFALLLLLVAYYGWRFSNHTALDTSGQNLVPASYRHALLILSYLTGFVVLIWVLQQIQYNSPVIKSFVVTGAALFYGLYLIYSVKSNWMRSSYSKSGANIAMGLMVGIALIFLLLAGWLMFF